MLSVSTAVFDGHPVEAGLDMLCELGVEAVEPAFIKGYVEFTEADFSSAKAANLKYAAKSRGLTIQALSAHIDLSADSALQALERRIEFASEIGSPFLITNAGPIVNKMRVVDTITSIAARLEARSVQLALENPGHGSGDLLGTPQQAAKFIQELDIPAVGLNLDIGNFATYADDIGVLADIQAALPQAMHIHLKDFLEVEGDWRFVPLGQGAIDWHGIAPIVSHLPLGIELPLRLTRPCKSDPKRRDDPVKMDVIRNAILSSIEHMQSALGSKT